MTAIKKKGLFGRFVAGLILCCILLGESAVALPALAAGSSDLTLNLGSYTQDLYIYNYLCFTSATGVQSTGSGSGIYTLQGASGMNIFVGDQNQATGNAGPKDSDIQMKWDGLTMPGKSMTVNPVYGGKRTVRAEVISASSIDRLIVSTGAKMVITLSADLTLEALELGEASSLEILTGGYTVTIGSATGNGALTLSESGNVVCSDIAAGTVTLNHVKADGQGTGRITAKDAIVINGATVQNMKLLGYDSTATGHKTISFTGGRFTNVEVIGAGDGTGAIITLENADMIAMSANTKYVFDYSITYMAGETELTPQSGWPVAYRVEHNDLTDAASTRVLGYISGNTFSACETVELPHYETDFSGFIGWKLDGTVVTRLDSAQKGNVVLAAELAAGTVTVEMVLGYQPGENTNDTPLPPAVYTTTSSTGSIIELDTPTRFGYIFKGWRMVSGSVHGTHYSSYTIAESDLDKVQGSDTFKLTLEAVWEKDKFSLRLQLGSMLNIDNLQISLDNGIDWKDFEAYVGSSPEGVTYKDSVLSFSKNIEYGQTLEEYFTEAIGSFPLLRDKTNTYTFAAWYNVNNGATVTSDGVYRYGDGILVRPQNVTLTEWQDELKTAPVTLAPLWVETTFEYTLSVNSLSDWKILVNGSEQKPDSNNEIKVVYGSQVTLCQPIKSAVSLSRWSITNVESVTERTYAAGDSHLYYDFSMPAGNVSLTLRNKNNTTDGEQLYLDLSKSPITFDEDVSYNGRKHKGFWLTVKSDDMIPLFHSDVKGYFYIWDETEPFHVTTNGVATKNQLTLVNAMPGGVYIKNCNLIATDEYEANARGRYLGGVLMEKAASGAPSGITQGTDWSSYGNIVLSVEKHASYDLTLNLRGTNTIASVMMSHAYTSSAYAGKLTITGESKEKSSLTLGSVLYFGKLYVKKLTVNEYNDHFEYLLYTLTAQMNCDNIDIADCKITAQHKRIYNSFNYFDIRNTELDIGSVFVAYSMRMYGTSYVRVRGDVVGYYYLINVSNSASLVVDGGVYTMSHTASYGNGSIETSGYVIVKGLGIVTTGLKVTKNPVIIANLITASRGSSFGGSGVIVTNMITNPLTAPPALSGDQLVVKAYTNADKCKDTNPFYSYSNIQETVSTVEFCGSRVYLFGYYKGSTGSYDVTNSLKDESNPVKSIMDSLLDPNSGDLLTAYRTASNSDEVAAEAREKVEQAIEDKTYVNNECVAFGDSTHDQTSKYAKYVKVTAGSIYAVGNVNFFNDTVVSGGTIECGGRFGARRDLRISGGSVKATEVGISYNRTTKDDGVERYSMLILAGGTVITDRIGSHSFTPDGTTAKGVVDRAFASAITPYTQGATIGVYSSLRTNYFYEKDVYRLEAGNPEVLDFVSTYSGTTLSAAQMQGEVTLVAPSLIDGSGATAWIYDNSNGKVITHISENGYANGVSMDGCVYENRLAFVVYAAKGSYVLGIKGDMPGFAVSHGSNTYKENTEFSAAPGEIITVAFDNTNVLDHTVVLYMDSAGTIHNVCKLEGSTVDRNQNTITFNMPYSDTEVWVTSEFTLYLDQHPVSFTKEGFALEQASDGRREDSEFEYAGNIRIAQNSSSTLNQIFFEAADSGNVTTGRKITLYNLAQQSLGTLFGTVLADGAKVELTIDGAKTTIAPVEVPYNSAITFVGAQGDATKNTLSFRSYYNLPTYLCVGSATRAGDITYMNLTLETLNYTQFARSNKQASDKTATFIGCIYSESIYYTYDTLAHNMANVIIRDCNFSITGSQDVSNTLVAGCTNLTIENSEIKFQYGGTRGGSHIFSGVSGTVAIIDSKLDVSYHQYKDSSATYLEKTGLYGNLVLSGKTEVTFDQRTVFKSLVMNDQSSLSVNGGGAYLLCPAITLNGQATLNAGHVLVSGFVVGEYDDKQAVLKALAAGSAINGASYSGLTVNGGTLNATHFVGGDKNAKIQINGGEVNTAALGTYGALFGYGKYIPHKMESESEFINQSQQIPVAGTVIKVSGGTVNISENGYLGGMYADAQISGGTVNLAEDAVLGMTEEQKTKVYNRASEQGKLDQLSGVTNVKITGGRIEGATVSAPYGTVNISGANTAVKVENLLAEQGSITISTTQAQYDNPHEATNKKEKVGVLVGTTLEALELYINDGAVVYAKMAYAYSNTAASGLLKVTDGAYLYVGEDYGARGSGNADIIKETEGEIIGAKRCTIHYVLNGDSIDPATNHEDNPSFYIFTRDDVTLRPPYRNGFDFDGWYDTEDFSGSPYITISADAENDYVLYAKWIPKKATFIVQIEATVLNPSFTVDDLKEETTDFGIEGTVDAANLTFTFAKIVEVAYRDRILGIGEGHVALDNYELRSYQIGELVFVGSGATLTPSSVVTKEMLTGNVVLKASLASNTRTKVSFNINLSGGKPLGYQFNYSSNPDSDEGNVIHSYIDIGKALETANGLTKDNELILPTAPGYDFGGWYTNKECTGDPINHEYVISVDSATTFYAKWTEREYYLVFDAGENEGLNHEKNLITADSDQPTLGLTDHKLVVYIAYDHPLSSAEYYWVDRNGTYSELNDHDVLAQLPSAWAQGFAHRDAWYFIDKNGNEKQITISTEFNLTNFNTAVDWTNLIAKEENGKPVVAVTLFPVLERTKITYDTNGGTIVGMDQNEAAWKQNYGSIEQVAGKNGVYIMQTGTYPMPMLGYTKDATASADYELTQSTTCMHDATYAVISTTAQYYATHKQFCTGDYRTEIGNKGYTFKGWRVMTDHGNGTLTPKKDAGGNDVYIGYFPQYEDVIVQAVWEANTYTVNLHPYDQNKGSEFYHADFHVNDSINGVSLTVGKEITDIVNWPLRTDGSEWFAYNTGLNVNELQLQEKRFLLGFTFDPLDPGSTDPNNAPGYTAYGKYSVAVSQLLTDDYLDADSDDIYVYSHSSGTTKGTIFRLPGDTEYHENKIEGTHVVPDYPEGSTIDMYAVYRERSLVFVEYYKDGAGNITNRFLASYPWDKWSDYPISENGYKEDVNDQVLNEQNGYQLFAWLVNGTTIGVNETYPGSLGEDAAAAEQAYKDNALSYKQAAEALGTYDIMIYTAYVARDEQSGVLNLNSNPNPLSPSSTVVQYTLPGSMQEGLMTYTIDLNGMELVNGESGLEGIRYDSSVSDQKVAIKATLYNSAGGQQESCWLTSGTNLPMFTAAATGGWKITLQMFHSSVVTKEKEHEFTLTIGFKSSHNMGQNDPLAYQQIVFSNSKISMHPSVYKVEYTADLPSDPIVQSWNGFDSETCKYINSAMPYGTTLLSTVPLVEGYHTDQSSWKSGSTSLAYGSELKGSTADALAQAAVIEGDATIRLSTTWTVKMHTLQGTPELLDKWNVKYNDQTLGTSPVHIPYRTVITVSPKTSGDYPEFVQMNLSSGAQVRLDDYTGGPNGEGEYTFTMPDADVRAIFQRLLTLYLENGSIHISEDGYVQGASDIVWHGDYTVLQNEHNSASAGTANTLTLQGSLGDRAISLGNLNMIAEHSISLAENTVATLTLKANDVASEIKALNVAVPSTAALTVDGQGGSLSLTPAANHAAIGGVNAANGSISLQDLSLFLYLNPSVASGIGPGNQTDGGKKITLTDCNVTVEHYAGNGVYSGVWVGGVGVDCVTLTNTTVSRGERCASILAPMVLNANAVNLSGCMIGSAENPVPNAIHARNTLTIENSQIHQSLTQGTVLGTDDGVTEVTNSTINSNSTTYAALYSGTLKIMDKGSCVVISGTQILEATHGDITITDTKVVQETQEFAHKKSYLILHELDGDAKPDLRVDSITASENVTIKGVEINTLTVNTDVKILIVGEVTLKQPVALADSVTLTTQAQNDATLTLEQGFVTTTKSNYVHTGGTLVAEQGIEVGGDLTLKDATVDASGKSIGSLGLGGATTVTVQDGELTADRIGALGAHNDTFTFVVEENAILNGTVVQDHYRLEYVIDQSFDTSALDKVLRSETTDGVTTYLNSIPNSPNPSDGFLFWYMLDEQGDILAIGYDDDATIGSVAELDDTHIRYAEQAATDGTRTLKIYAFMNLTISGSIESGKLLNQIDFTSNADTVQIYGSGKWTAMFLVNGSSLAGYAYELALGNAFPQGTVLTLGVMHQSIPTFYYYKCTGNEKIIPLTAFTRMGTTDEHPALLDVEAGTKLAHVLILAADFSAVSTDVQVTNAVTLQVASGTTSMAKCDLGYTATASATVKSEDTASRVTVEFGGDVQLAGKLVYLVATLTANTEIPYDAQLVIGNATASRIDQSTWVIALGDAIEATEFAENYRFDGLAGGSYELVWTLTLAERGTENVRGCEIARSQTTTITVREEVAGSLLLGDVTVDGVAFVGHELAEGKEHTVILPVTSNQTVSVKLEMQGEDGSFTEVAIEAINPIEVGYSITLPSTLGRGMYRITLSIEPGETADDVYVPFMLTGE